MADWNRGAAGRVIPEGTGSVGARLAELAAVSICAIGLTLALLVRTPLLSSEHPSFPEHWDHHKYIAMATDGPGSFHVAPFCWRVLVPLLARAMPGGLETGFLLVSVAGIWLTGVVLYYTARAMLGSRVYSAMAVLMFLSLGWGPRFALFDFWLPDAASFLFVMLAVRAALARRAGWLAAALAVGVSVKESVLFAGPLYYTLNETRPVDLRLFGRAVAAMLPALAVLVAIRTSIPALNADPTYAATVPFMTPGDRSYDYVTLLRTIGVARLASLSPENLWTYTVGTFGLAPVLLAAVALRSNALLLARFLPFLALVYAQILFTLNIQRLLVLGFPAVILLALHGIRALAGRWHLPAGAFLPVPLSSLVVTLFGTRGFTPPLAAQALLLALALALVLAYAARHRRPGSGQSDRHRLTTATPG